ncbi:MAG: hypothetical protein ACRC6N_11120 [Plesiomonas sp.]|uniref:hypothetical protein n=1 Tax=Plesiomonas sp. TaxID=2486279 RepID=UPI003F2BC5C5
MQIPFFPLPSKPSVEIKFRMPSVADAMSYSHIDHSQEESITTRYLNDMQFEEANDSALWTVQDRRTALWWIFCNSRIDTSLTASYTCSGCGKEHFYDYDARNLDMTAGMLTVEPFELASIPVNGVAHEWILKPLDGRAIEHLEAVRQSLPSASDPDYAAEIINLRLMELTHQAHLQEQPDDFIKAAEFRYSLIKSMTTDTEFSPLVASIELMNRNLAHGLSMRIEKGAAHLLLPEHKCPESGKGGQTDFYTRLYTPFRNRNFLPEFRPQWMAGVNN